MGLSATAQAGALDSVRRLGLDLLQSRSHVNNAPVLISILSASCTSGATSAAISSPKCLLEALTSLQAFFLPLLRSGELSPASRKRARIVVDVEIGSAKKRRKSEEQGGAQDEGSENGLVPEQAEAIYTRWLWEKYREFTTTLLKLLSCEHDVLKVQVAALHACMELVRTEGPSEFSNSLFLKLCATVVGSTDFTKEILELLHSEYFKYADVSYFTYSNLHKLVLSRINSKEEDVATEEDKVIGIWKISMHDFAANVFNILSRLPPPSEDAGKSVDDLWSMRQLVPENSANLEKGADTLRNDGNGSEKAMLAVSWKSLKIQRFKFSNCWLAFLQLDLPLDIYKKVLAQMHRTVIPYLTNPVLLSDFLTTSYNVGGLVSVMALNSLFILITKYGLEYPDFYNKLYALLEPTVFVAKYRARFFELLDTCLKSSHLPAYLAAAFAKKLGRLGLTAPPSGGLLVIAMIHNLLRRHPSINCLVHRQDSGAEDSALDRKEPDADLNDGVDVDPATTERPDSYGRCDPFMPFEADPAKCNALKSSLWEIDALRRHYCPAVSRFVACLETDLTVRAKTTEVAISDFSSGSYATIFSEEVGRRLKQVPLAFYDAVPPSLFLPSETDDFAGWKFDRTEATAHKDAVQNV